MGAYDPSNAYNPAAEPVPDALAIGRWATGYFEHPDLASRDPTRLNFKHYLSDPSPLIDRLEPEYIARTTLDASAIDGPLLLSKWREANERGTKEALRKVKDGLWTRVKHVSVIWGERTFWLTPPALWALEDYSKELGGSLLEVKTVKGGNHFVRPSLRS